MLPRGAEARRGLRWGLLSLVAAVSLIALSSDPSAARDRHKRFHDSEVTTSDSPRYADIVVDGNTGAILHAENPDSPRHPASLTKVMTLYLLFEQLEAGKLKLDTPLEVSEHAAEQSPTKLGLHSGQTIKVEEAIKGMVTRSANDAAVVVAEGIGGDEETFAKMMTRKAQALGMMHTLYRNASGLPNDEQVSTARDQATLGRAIQERFPTYYRYFSTRSFDFRGQSIGNHNHLLGSVDGVDGIKTGYVSASGFNILTSLHRSGRYLVAVVFGGSSASSRDERMRGLISEYIAEASTQRSPTLIADASSRTEPRPDAKPAAKPETRPEAKSKPEIRPAPPTYEVASVASVPVRLTSRSDPGTATTIQVPRWVAPGAAAAPTHGAPSVGSADPIRPVMIKTVSVHAGNLTRTASLGLLPIAAPTEPSPPVVAQVDPPAPPPNGAQPPPRTEVPFPPPVARAGIFGTPPTHAATGSVASAAPVVVAAPPVPPSVTPPPAVSVTPALPAALQVATAAPAPPVHGGWMIQVGAFPAENEAKLRLSSVQSRAARYLASADPFTETVNKGDTVLYRARFAGLAKDQAEAACNYLKHNDVDCLTIKN